ncbi:MAG: 50S ribosomal protein L18a [Euryarchaeota archaeon]|nr:50S ribosomal protein L18a [Euryarchaeota archaeon]MDE2046318.1 50S ribosomal protein L18a [Thermoplasmata archaeon]
MPSWAVRGSYLARRDTWQRFTKVREAPSAEQAKEIVYSEIGGSHRVARQGIRIDSVEPAKETK